MDMAKYQGLFHDGRVVEIKHYGSDLYFSLESAEICDGDLQENIPLTYRYFPYLKGRLHLKGIEKILIDNELFFGTLKKKYDYGKIFDLTIHAHKVEIDIIWEPVPSDIEKEDFSTIEIEAKTIYWENTPNNES